MVSLLLRMGGQTRAGFAVLVTTLYLFSFAGLAAAQQAAGIIGQVTDESGAVLPGVTVTATSPALQVPQVIDVTNERGEYRLTPLPIGTYAVEYRLPGFQTVVQAELRLTVGLVARLDSVMKVGTLEETVTVSGQAPVVDVTSTAASTQLTRETLELTPTSRNSIISLAAQAPGVRGNIDVGGGTVGAVPSFKTFGQPTESQVVMEGILTSDMRIGSQGGNYFNYAALEEVRVQSIGNGPEVSSRGVSLNMVTKSGGNTFHGGGEAAYTSHRFESNNVSDALRAQGITSGNPLVSRGDLGGDLGGRIVRDKLWFYGAARYRPNRNYLLQVFKPDGTQGDAYTGEIIESQKVSYQMDPSNRFVYWGQWAQKYTTGENVDEFTAWESRKDGTVRTNTWKIEWQGTKGNSLVMSVLFGRWAWTGGGDIAEISGKPPNIRLTVTNAEEYGGGRPSTFDRITRRVEGTPPRGGNYADIWRYTTKGTLSWFRPDLLAGNHEFKAGIEHQPEWYSRVQGDRGAAGQYRLIFANGVAEQADLFNWPVSPLTGVRYLSVYGNDTWTVSRRLTLDLGARFAHDLPDIPAQCRPAGAWPFAAAACIDKVPFKSYSSIAPRLYFAYDVTGDAKTLVKGGWGRFMLARFLEQPERANPFTSITYQYRWRDLNNNRNYDPGEINLDPNGPDFIGSNASGGGVTNPNEKVPGTDQFALTLERQLGGSLAVRASAVYIRTFNEPRLANVLRPYESYNIPITNPDPGSDGVLRTADDPGTFVTYFDFPAALAGLSNEQFMFINDSRSNETHKAFEFQVVKRISDRWQLLAAYTATKNDTLVPHPGNAASEFNPNVEINTGDHTREWIGRASAAYMARMGLNLSANFEHRSGDPQARTVQFRGGRQIPVLVVNVEPLGSLRLPNMNVLDLRIGKSFALAQGHQVAVRANLYNALNASTVLARSVLSGPTYMRPTRILSPRIVEFGMSYSF
jgi:hypothetical protein